MCLSLHLPEMAVHARGEDRKDYELEIVQYGVVGVMEEKRCEYVCHRKQKTTYIIKNIMIHQDNVQTACGYPPVLYGAYECEGQKSQFECAQKKKWYEELETTRALVAPCNTWYRTNCIYRRCSCGEGNADGCPDKSKKNNQHSCEQNFVVVPERACSEDEKGLGANS